MQRVFQRVGGMGRSLADSVVVTNLLLLVVGILGLVVTARYLGVSDRGRYLTWSSWCVVIGTLSMLGTEAFVVVAATSMDTRVSLWNLRAILGLGLALAGSLALVTMAWIEPDPMVVAGGMLVAMSGPIVALHAHVQQANGHHGWRFNASRALAPVSGFACVLVALVLFRSQAEGLFLALGAGLFIGASSAVALAWEPAERTPGILRTLFDLGRRGAPLTFLTWLLLNVDTVAVSVFGDSAKVGLYGVGVAARSAVVAVGSAVGLTWFATRGSMTPRSVARSFAPAVVAAVGAVVLAPLIVPGVLGDGFAPSVAAAQVLSVAGLLASLDFLLGRVVLLRVGYRLPTVLRGVALALLIFGIGAVQGDPTGSARVYCLVVGGSVLGQVWVLRRLRASSRPLADG